MLTMFRVSLPFWGGLGSGDVWVLKWGFRVPGSDSSTNKDSSLFPSMDRPKLSSKALDMCGSTSCSRNWPSNWSESILAWDISNFVPVRVR